MQDQNTSTPSIEEFTSEKLELKLSFESLAVLDVIFHGMFLGYREEDINHRLINGIIHDDDLFLFRNQLENKNQSSSDFQIRIRHFDNQFRWVKVFFYRKANHFHLILFSNDIKETTQNNFESFNKMAHDVRSPMTSILGITQLLHLEIESLQNQKELNHWISLINQNCNKALDITNSIMDLALLQSQGYKFQKEKTDFKEFLQHYVQTHRIKGFQKKIELKLNVPEHNNVMIELNKNSFTRLLDNILSNSIKFSPRESSINIKLSSDKMNAILSIEDQGMGMPKEVLDHLFEPFGPARRIGLEGEKSNGLGLSIVKQIIELHEGKMEIQSEVDKGSTFAFTLKIGKTFG